MIRESLRSRLAEAELKDTPKSPAAWHIIVVPDDAEPYKHAVTTVTELRQYLSTLVGQAVTVYVVQGRAAKITAGDMPSVVLPTGRRLSLVPVQPEEEAEEDGSYLGRKLFHGRSKRQKKADKNMPPRPKRRPAASYHDEDDEDDM